jgi:hypothetical protein
MKTKLPLLVCSAALAAFVSFSGGAQAAEIDPGVLPVDVKNLQPYSIIQQPESVVARKGAFVAFSVRVYPENEVISYKWHFQTNTANKDAFEVLNSQTRELFLAPSRVISTNGVGAYSVVVTWKNGSTATSSNAFLSIYEAHGGNSTYGTLTKSMSDFGGGVPTLENFCSDSHPDWKIFDRVNLPADPSGAVYSFYGPGVSVGLQVGPFINSGRNKYLKIDTTNNPVRTMVRLWNNLFQPTDGNALDCEAGLSDVLPIMEYYNMATTTDVNRAQYKLTIYYSTLFPPPAGRNIVMHWIYFD